MKVENVQVSQDSQTRMWQAWCNINEFSKVSQWGITEKEALENLKRFITDTLQIEWPEEE